MTGFFHLKCLGEPELRGPDGKLVRFRVKKHLALLVYLAVESRQRHDRARLVEMFWPRAAPKQGRHSLATALSVLRAVFGRAAFPTGGSAVRFAPTELSLDLDRLAAGDILGAGDADPLEVDGFLRGFDLPDATEFAFWKDREHARRLPAIHAAILTLIDHGRRRGSHEEIMQRAERLLALDHLAEEGVRATMEALVLAGDRFSALRTFDEWKERLADELDAEPSSLLEGMAAQLRKRGWEPREPVAMPPVPAEQWRDQKFVGRRVEYRTLYETWEATHQFRPRHVHVVGDSGVGKSTLAQRLVTAAGLEGASVARVQCYHLEQRLPYAAIRGLVAGLLGRPGVAATAPSALAEIARIVPQVKDHFAALPAPRPSEGETARLLFAEGVMDLFGAVMDERPLLLVLDDYHLSDEASLAVLHLILRRLDRGRYMVVVTTRPHDEAETPQARRIREGMARLRMDPLTLHPMSDDESSELLGVILEALDRRPRPPEWRALVRASRGFPMALELLTQDWYANGARSLALSLGAMTPSFGGEGVERMDGYALVAERVLLTLSHSARQVITLAALLGSRMSDLGLFGLVDLSFGQTVEGVSELTTRRLLRSVGASLEFINELVRAHVYRQIPGSVRIAMHAAIADRLLAMESGGTAIPGLEVAWHLMRSGRVAAATPRLFQGAAEAKERGAPDEAVLAVESALPSLDSASRGRAQIVLVDVLQELGRWSESEEVLDHLEPIPPELAGLARVLELHARWQQGVHSTFVSDAVILALKNIYQSGDPVGGPQAYLLAARLAGHSEHPPMMESVLRWATPKLRRAETSSDPLPVLIGRAILHYNRRDLVKVAQLTKEARTAAAIDRADSVLVRLVAGEAALRIVSGDYEAARQCHLEAIKLAERLDNETLLGELYSAAALTHLGVTKYQSAANYSDLAIARLNAARAQSYVVHAVANGGLAAALLGAQSQVSRALTFGDDLSRNVPMFLREDWLLSKADIYWATGRRSQALKSAKEVVRAGGALPPRTITGKYVRWLFRLWLDPQFRSEYESDIGTKLTTLMEHIDSFDAIDCVDIAVAATEAAARNNGFAPDALRAKVTWALGRLSNETVCHLRNIGVLA